MTLPSSPRAARARGLVLLAATGTLVLSLLPPTAQAAAPAARPVTGVAEAKVPVPTTAAANARMMRKVPQRLTARALGRSVSVQVADADGGSAVYSRAALVPRLGASNMKLVTAVAAMQTMGLDKRFPTTVVAQGARGRKVVVVAGGDPVLTSGQLGALADRTAAALVATLPAAPTPVDPPPAPGTGDPTNPATPPPPSAPVAPPIPVKFPVYVDDSLFAPATLAPGWPAFYQPHTVRPVRALVRDGRQSWDTSTEAGAYFAYRLRTSVNRAVADRLDLNVTVRFKGRTAHAGGAQEIARFDGNRMAGALAWMLLVSDNNIAEMLYRQSALASGFSGTWAGGRAAATQVLAGLGVRTKDLVIADGSGVSRRDRLTAFALVQLLQAASSPRNPQLLALRSMLPVSGVSGTLKSSNGRYTTAPSRCARGLVQAKTGTLHDVVALSGYTRGADGRLKVFSVLVNKRPEHKFPPLTTRRAVDNIAATVTGCA